MSLLLLGTSALHAQDLRANLTSDAEEARRDRSDGAVAPALLNAFGCVGLNGEPFAGRYESIDVFADLASLSPRRPNTSALVFGKLTPGIFPEMLSAALVEWTASLEQADRSFLLHGFALRPDGAKLLVRLRLPRAPGVYKAVIRTDDLSTGDSQKETIICTVR